MYLFRPDRWFGKFGSDISSSNALTKRKGGGKGGGPRGGGSRGGGGRGGSGRSGGGTSSAGRTGSTLRSGGSRGGSVSNARTLGSSMKGPIWSRPSTSYYSRSVPRPLIGGYVLLFGFWPIIWLYDYPDGALPTNNTRPGGDLITASIIPSECAPNITYILYGDQQSVEDILPTLSEFCSAINATTTFNPTANTTVEIYREDSFYLLGVGLDGVGRNTSFEACLNQTIGDNLLVLESGGEKKTGTIGVGLLLILAVCTSLAWQG